LINLATRTRAYKNISAVFIQKAIFAIFINLKNENVLHIDSNGETEEIRKQVRKNWASYWRKRGRKTEIDWIHITYTHVDQTGNFNCGVCVLLF